MHTSEPAGGPATGIQPDPSALRDPARLAVLAASSLVGTPAEEAFDRLTRLAAGFLNTPLALVNVVDDHKQYSKSCFVPPDWPGDVEAPLADSYCKWVVVEREPVVIADTRLDERVSGSRMTTELGLASYLGIPLLLSNGAVLGSLCVAGFEPREWTARELSVLSDLAALVVTEIELRLDLSARRQLERLKDELVSVVAHELRTPLTSIRGSLGLLAGGGLDPASPQARRMVQIAAQNSDRLVRLINDMLDLERFESGSLELDLGDVLAAPLVEEAVDSVRHAASAAGARVEWSVAPELALHADRDRVVQVLVNLLANAVKFSPRDGLVQVLAERRGEEAVFQVRDHGRGIPPEMLDVVFDRFRQVDSSDARDKGGTGLGLPICRSIVQQHGGRIWAASAVGSGSTFFFTLPAAAGAADGEG
ncbi:MAG: GAF domain-containing sensor histidine kinase [Gemmatimonadota bacterium]